MPDRVILVSNSIRIGMNAAHARFNQSIELSLRAEEVRQSQHYDRRTTVRPITLIEQGSPVRNAGSRSPR